MPLISVNNLIKTFCDDGVKTRALRGVNLDVQEGEFVGVMGPSGSGKSTLLHILGLLDRPTKGDYFLEQKPVKDFSDEKLAQLRNEKMGFVFQAFNLLGRTSVLGNVVLPLMYSEKEFDRQKRAKKVIEAVGLTKRLSHTPAQLSGGERERVAIARALVNEPDIIFADEPTGNLDTKTGDKIMAVLEELHRQGQTILLITHERRIVEYAERIVNIKDGKII